jgi:hypothetical protein
MDRIGVLGLMMVALGAAIVVALHGSMPLWAKWLIGPLLWYCGFALLLAWAFLRAFAFSQTAKDEVEDEEEALVPEPKQPRIALAWSNFLEHGQDNVA